MAEFINLFEETLYAAVGYISRRRKRRVVNLKENTRPIDTAHSSRSSPKNPYSIYIYIWP